MSTELPPNILCLTWPDTGRTVAVIRPSSYQELVACSATVFHLTNFLTREEQEIYFESHDFGFGGVVVEVLPEVWDAVNERQFFKWFNVRVRKAGTGPPNRMPQVNETRSNVRSITPESSASSSKGCDGARQSLHHPTVAPRTNYAKRNVAYVRKDEMMSEGEEERSFCDLESKAKVVASDMCASSVSPQAQADTGKVRPIKVKRGRGREADPPSQPAPEAMSSHLSDAIVIPIRCDSREGTFKARPHTALSNIVDRACKYFGLDRTRAKLLRMDTYDGSLKPCECSLKDTVGSLHPKVTKDDLFILRTYEPSESE